MSEPEDLQAALAAAESDADRSFDERPVGSPVLPCGRAVHWVAFELLEEGEPAAGVRYELRLPGRVVQGALNSRGRVRVEGITEAGTCTITFPELDAGASGGGEQESEEGAEELGVPYIPGRAPAPVALDAAYRYRVPDWDLIELEVAPPGAAPAAEGGGGEAGELSEEEAEEQDDWDVTSIAFAEEG